MDLHCLNASMVYWSTMHHVQQSSIVPQLQYLYASIVRGGTSLHDSVRLHMSRHEWGTVINTLELSPEFRSGGFSGRRVRPGLSHDPLPRRQQEGACASPTGAASPYDTQCKTIGTNWRKPTSRITPSMPSAYRLIVDTNRAGCGRDVDGRCIYRMALLS